MSQVTIYIDDDTEERTRAAARTAGVPLSRWISDVLRSRVGTAWPAEVVALEGSWRTEEEAAGCDATEAGDLAREPL